MALMLAGLRGIDESLWMAARIDGIPAWRTYASVGLPMPERDTNRTYQKYCPYRVGDTEL